MSGACTLPCFADREACVHCWLSVERVGVDLIADFDYILMS